MTTKLAHIRALVDGGRDFPPSGKTLGLRMIEASEGSTTLEMEVTEAFLNRGGGVQGGFLAALADAAMGTSLATVCQEDESHATLEFKLNFVKPATAENSPLRAIGHVLHRSRRVAHTDGEIHDASGDLVAKATASWAIRKVQKGPAADRE